MQREKVCTGLFLTRTEVILPFWLRTELYAVWTNELDTPSSMILAHPEALLISAYFTVKRFTLKSLILRTAYLTDC
jgi:hypothetical protein